MMMPYGSAFMVNNLGIPMTQLPTVYIASGVAAFFTGPLIGRVADSMGKYRLFFLSTVATIVVVVVYTHLEGPVSLAVVIGFSLLMFASVTGRMVTSQALVSAVPDAKDRGAFMAINSALQQISGGIAAVVGGLLIVQRSDGGLDHFDRIGWAVALAAVITLFAMRAIDRAVQR
jgi:predicted MFS family arabinose efflux permease